MSETVGTSIQPPTISEPRHTTLAGQEAAFAQHSRQAANLAAHVLTTYQDRVFSLALERLRDGYPIFEYDTWELDEEQIWNEAMEEAADLVNYLVMMLERRGA